MALKDYILPQGARNRLDPKVCRGDQFYLNILVYLGAKEKILKNPYAFDRLAIIVQLLSSKHGITITGEMITNPSKKDINEIVDALQSERLLSKQERTERYKNGAPEAYFGLGIDETTGCITIGELLITGEGEDELGTSYLERKFALDEEDNLVEIVSNSFVNPENKSEKLFEKHKTVFNSDGIEMKATDIDYNKDLEIKSSYERDPDHPYIVRKTVNYNKRTSYGDDLFTEDQFGLIYLGKLHQVRTLQKDTNKCEITDADREWLIRALEQEIYQAYIEEAFFPDLDDDASMLKQRQVRGLQKLAKTAGLFPDRFAKIQGFD